MAVIVPSLRLFLLFVNVFETFKTLKPPRRSPRSGEQTPRAISQRKRDMKGCMAIWLLWCSCSVVEGLADTTIGLVMPFYNEIKAIVYLFQIITRARGAEPVYLHVMRPLVKPYVTTLDYALEFVHMLGDFVALIVSLPFGFVSNWWSPTVAHGEPHTPESEHETVERATHATEVQRDGKPTRQPSNGHAVGTRTRGVRQTSDTAKASNAGPSRISRPDGIPQSRSDTAFNQQKHKIWHPRSNARDEDDEYERPQTTRRIVSDSAATTLATAVESSMSPILPSNDISEASMVVGDVEEWRQYPPFPSAYPATPQVKPRAVNAALNIQQQSTLSAVYGMPQPQFHPSALPQPCERPVRLKPPVTQSLPSRNGFWSVARADACKSNVEDSGLHGGSGDEFGLTEWSPDESSRKVGRVEAMDLDETREHDMDVDEDEDDEDDEDDDNTVNVTLRTPQRLKTAKNVASRTNFAAREVSPPPELLAFHRESQEEYDEEKFGIMAGAAGPSSLEFSHQRRRSNSNYTLSSTRASRADSEASFTTVSRASSTRTFSHTPSLGSRPSGGSTSEAASDTSSVAGVKRPRPTQGKALQKKAEGKSNAKRVVSQDPNNIIGRGIAARGMVRTRPPLSQVGNSIRTRPPVVPKPASKVSARRSIIREADAYDTLEGADEVDSAGTGGRPVPSKRRKVKAGGPVDRAPSSLAKIPEERPTVRDRR